jgi:Na+/melibiose symporter-like transporter
MNTILSPLWFALSMVGVGIELVVIGIMLGFSIYLQIEGRKKGQDYLADYDEALEEIQNSMNVIAQVLHKLPEMVPQFQINENPLTQILQFFQQRAEQQASLGATQLRDDNGRYSDGTKETEKTP